MTTRSTRGSRRKPPAAVQACTAAAFTAFVVAVVGCPGGSAAAAAAPAAEPHPATVAPTPGAFDRVAVKRMVVEEAQNSLVPPALALALAKVESNFQATALSASGARGVMQIAPEDARLEFGVDPEELWDPRLNIQLGLDRLGRLYQHHGRWDLALSHYRAGGIEGLGTQARPLPASRSYVDAVLRWRDRYEAQNAVWAALHDAPEARRSSAGNQENNGGELVGRAATAPAVDAAVAGGSRRWPAVPFRMVSEANDDFLDIDTRRAIAGPYLDDFSPPVRVVRER